MSNRLPEFVDPLHLVERCQGFKGTIELAKMKRLASLLAEPVGHADLEILFARDSAGLALATGKVKALVRLQCQRCLKPMDFVVDSEFCLGVVSSLAEARSLPDNYEPLVVDQGSISLAELVEDEILLALPAIAVHTENCSIKEAAVAQRAMPETGSTQKTPQHMEKSLYNARPAGDADEQQGDRQNPFAVLAGLKEKLRK